MARSVALVLLAAAGASAAGEATAEPSRAPAVLFIHFILMLLSWGLLLPLGVVYARRGRAGYGAKDGAWFSIHKALQYTGWTLQLAGFVCAVIYVQLYGTFGHFAGPHEILGLVVVALGSLQPVNAFFRPHKPEGEPKPRIRLAWELLHKGVGYGCVGLSILVIALGLQYLILLNYDSTTFLTAVVVAVAFFLFWTGTLALSCTPLWPAKFRFAATVVGAGPPSKDGGA